MLEGVEWLDSIDELPFPQYALNEEKGGTVSSQERTMDTESHDNESHKGLSYGFNRPVTIAQSYNKNGNKNKQRLLFYLKVF